MKWRYSMRRKGTALMKKALLSLCGVVAIGSAVAIAQAPKAATYITDEDVKAVNALPGVDRTIKVVDIGPENFAVGIIHRGATGGAARGAAAGGGAARGAGAGAGAAAGGGPGAGGGARRGAGGRGGRGPRRRAAGGAVR